MVFTGTKVLTLSNDSSPSSVKFQVSRFSKFLWLRVGTSYMISNPLYQTHAYTVWSVLHVMYVILMCSIRDKCSQRCPVIFILRGRRLKGIMASNRYLISLVKLWLFVILLDFFILLYFITVKENRKISQN